MPTTRSRPTGRRSSTAGRSPCARDLYQIVYTSGTTSAPKGVMLTHGNMLSTVEVCKALLPPRHLRVVSLLPLSHLFEQAPVLMYGTMIGAEVMYVRSRNPRVIFETLRELRVNTMIVTPQLMELFWSAITREVDKQGKRATFERARTDRPATPLLSPGGCCSAPSTSQLGGEFRLFVSAGAYLPPELQRSWEDLGVIVLQGYGSTECGPAAANTEQRHPVGVVGRHIPPIQLRLAEGSSEIEVAGPSVSPGYWQDPEATAAAFHPDGWYRTGDIGHFNKDGDLVLSGRTKNIIVLPNGLNVFPEDVEAALQRPRHHAVGGARDGARPDRGGRAATRDPAHHRARSRRPGGTGRGAGRRRARRHRSHHQAGEHRAGHPPAHRRVAAVAGAGLPADPHAQGPARRDPGMGRVRYPAPGPRHPRGLTPAWQAAT